MTTMMRLDPKSGVIHNAIDPWEDARLRHRLALLGLFPLQPEGFASQMTGLNARGPIAALAFEGMPSAIEKSPSHSD